MTKRTKFIPVTKPVSSDGLVITDDEGNEYHPHAGEWVVFRRDLPWRMINVSADMPNDEYCQLIISVLLRQVKAWNWTGDDGEPLPQPNSDGFEDVLWDLGAEERQWLRDNCWEGANLPNP